MMEIENIDTENIQGDSSIKPRSLRISKANLDKINEIKAEFPGGSQEAALAGLINLFELENAKGLVMDRKAEIEQVQTLADQIMKAYIYSLQMYANVEDTVKAKFSNKLESNLEIIQGLQGDKNKLVEALEQQVKINEEITDTIAEQEKELAQLSKNLGKTEELCGEYKSKNSRLDSTLLEYQGYKDLNETLSKEGESLQNEIKELNHQLSEQEQKHKTDIIELNENHSRAINEVEKQLAESEQQRKLDVLELKNEHSEAIRELLNQHNNEIDSTNKEYKGLLNELEALRKENFELEKKLMQRSDAVPEEEVTEVKPKRRTKKTENQ